MSLASIALLALAPALLTPGVVVRRTISGPGADFLQIKPVVGQLVTGSIEQGETDFTIDVLGPDARVIATFDGRERGTDLFTFLAVESGVYRIKVRKVAPGVRSSTYTIRLDPFRTPTADDDRLIEAERLATDAKALFGRGDRDSLLAARAKWPQVRELWRMLRRPSLEVAAVIGAGDTSYVLTDYARAEEAYREALAMSREQRDRRTEAEVLNNLAMVAWPLGRIPEALALLEEALAGWHELKFAYGEASALSNRGILLKEVGEFDEARQHYVRALRLFQSLHDTRGQAYALNNIGTVLEDLGKPEDALRSLQRAVILFRAVRDHLAEGRALLLRSRIQLALGRRQASLANVERSLQLVRQAGDRLAEADALHQRGRIFAAAGTHLRAQADFGQALALHRDVGSRRGEADDLHDTGLSVLASGQCSTAREFLGRALEVRRSIGLRRPEAETLFRLAQADRSCDDLAAAELHLTAAVALTEQIRSRVFEQEFRTSYLSANRRYFTALVDVLVEQHRRRPGEGFDALAFRTAEQGRARELIERLRETWTGPTAIGNSKLLEQERDLRKQLNYWSWQLWQQADNRKGNGLADRPRSRIDSLLAEHADIEARLRRSEPGYAALADVEPASLATFQREILDDQTVLLEYMLGDDRSYVWAITKESVSIFDLARRTELERRARQFHRRLSTSRLGPPDPQAAARLQKDAAELGRLLLAPVAATLERRRVLVVPDGALHYVPFATLIEPVHHVPLTLRHELVTLPSATMLTLLRGRLQGRPPAAKLLAVLADPVFDVTDPRVRASAPGRSTAVERIEPMRRLSRLPFSREEADRILAAAPFETSLKALDFDASRTTATGTDLSQYRILHFATHAVQDDEHPGLSGIVLSLVRRDGNPQDGFLRLHDLFGLRLQADLVVLSACETGTGRQTGGEGLASLSRGFFYAGAARVVSSLWKVDDEATARLMELFYKALFARAQMSPAAALQAAQTAMMKQKRWEDPHYWSAFVLQGDW